jgi:hypothetical protein
MEISALVLWGGAVRFWARSPHQISPQLPLIDTILM